MVDIKYILSVLCVVYVLQAGHSVSAQKPKFCQKYDCPIFKVLNKTDDYELRLYKPTNWVATSEESPKPFMSAKGMFWRLFYYILGWNGSWKTISMTVPVATKVTLPTLKKKSWTSTMCFYLKSESNPKPSSNKVFLTKLPATKMYVRSFEGFAKAKDWSEHIKALMNALPEGSYEGSYFYTAGYNSPFQMKNRHNEVWVVAKN
ncbi:hypothetical protein Ahia01_001324900 [Argonauta hians]